MLKILIFIVLLIPLLAVTAHAETQTAATEKGTLDIRLEHDKINPGETAKIHVGFINPTTENIQEHIDYTIAVDKDGQQVFGPIPLTHTSPGTVTIPILFNLGDGIYTIGFTVEGILFQPIPPETASFDIVIGDVSTETPDGEVVTVIPSWIKNNAGWWADGQIDDATFVTGLEYMIQNQILVVPVAPVDGISDDEEQSADIPPWVKKTAGWWADGQIDDATFVGAIQYLVGQGIIRI